MTYLVKEFVGTLPFYSMADARRTILTTQLHTYRIEMRDDTVHVYVDSRLYSDVNHQPPLTPIEGAAALFNANELDRLRQSGLLIKAVDPNHHMLNRKPYPATKIRVVSARMTVTTPTLTRAPNRR